MIWILGADEVGQQLARKWPIAPFRFIGRQLEHQAWAGVHFYDLIFPLFVFIAGVSIVLAIPRHVERYGRGGTVRRILLRGAILFLLGILYNGGLSHPWPNVRIMGVLQRIALAYTAAALLFVYVPRKVMAATLVAILAGYWALLTYVPVRDFCLEQETVAARFGGQKPPREVVRAAFDRTTDFVRGRYDAGLNLTNEIDFEILPGRMYDRYWDPEGLLSTLPGIATCLLGVFAGAWLKRTDRSGREKVIGLLLGAAAALVVGYWWGLQFPIVKKIWTSSFVLVAGGWALVLLACFYLLVDVLGWRRWTTPLVWIGMNPITLYLATALISFGDIAGHIVGYTHPLLLSAATLGVVLLLAWFLFERKIFLRV